MFRKKQSINENKKLFLIKSKEITEHKEWICSMNIFPSGNLISVSRDKSIKIYNNLEIIQDIENAHNSDINYIEIIDENNFITCSNDKSIIFWNKK